MSNEESRAKAKPADTDKTGTSANGAPSQKALANRLTAAIATPIVLLLILGVVLGRQIVQMSDDARWVDHSDQVIATMNDTVRQIIDQETAVRAYLLTEDRSFLDPYYAGRPGESFDRLNGLVADNPIQQARFREARERYNQWLHLVEQVVRDNDKASIVAAKSMTGMRERKARMDAVRESMKRALDIEEDIRHERVAKSNASAELTRILFVGLIGSFAAVLAFLSRRQLATIAATFGSALSAETQARRAVEKEAWIRAGIAKVVKGLQGEKSLAQLGNECLATLASYTKADVGAFFTKDAGSWRRRAGLAIDASAEEANESFPEGEGIVGRAADIDGPLLHLKKLPAGFLRIRGGTGEAAPNEVIVIPARIDGKTNAVIELGFLKAPSARALELFGRLGESVALAVRSAEHKERLRELLEESQRQAEELQTQQEELRVANEELEAQTTALRTTQKQLETQQAELEQTNDHLTHQSKLLERQNAQLAQTQTEIATKAAELERASQFKSEFLSNMSHELRTPLNSSLILAKLLADNKDGNLTAEQVKFAETIYSAGNDLLTLINDILDLSKIEAGKMDVHAGDVALDRLRESLRRTFEPVAVQRGLRFTVNLAASVPTMIATDSQRLEQILKNLISNALKFTERGEVSVDVSAQGERISFAVRDTGIGIPIDQQKLIFDVFRQADGTTNRKYGGTGLGLSISRELARLLGGDVSVSSEPQKGSTFTLSLPRVYAGEATLQLPVSRMPVPSPVQAPAPAPAPIVSAAPKTNGHTNGEHVLDPHRNTVLLIEDDEAFAEVLADVARESGFRCVRADTAQRGLELAKKHTPMGIVLDMKLPDHTGLSVLDRLKRDPATRHIPVHVVSATDFTAPALSMGATGYLMKPVRREQLVDAFRLLEARSTHRIRKVLVVDDDAQLRDSVSKLLGRSDVEISTAASAAAALDLLRKHTFDCIVTDLGLPDQSGYDLLETMATEEPYSVPPVIVYTGRALTAAEETRLRKYSRSIIVKGARSPERLLDEVTLFLHQVEAELPADQQRLLKEARHREAAFEGKNILVVEDDVRNVFALSSVLEPKGAKVVIARNGKEALSVLEKGEKIDLVLMDIMMPEMDGLEATRRIRKMREHARLPIIALTAKAMPDDQERCLAAGASDYIAKPLDVEMLLSLLRVWMQRA